MDFTDYVRLANGVLATITLVAYFVRVNDDWARMTRGWRVLRLSVLGMLFVLGFASVEIMLSTYDTPLGIRTLLAGIVTLGALVGLIMIRNEGLNDGWIRASDIQDVLDEIETAHAHIACNPPAPGCLIARDRMRTMIKAANKKTAASM